MVKRKVGSPYECGRTRYRILQVAILPESPMFNSPVLWLSLPSPGYRAATTPRAPDVVTQTMWVTGPFKIMKASFSSVETRTKTLAGSTSDLEYLCSLNGTSWKTEDEDDQPAALSIRRRPKQHRTKCDTCAMLVDVLQPILLCVDQCILMSKIEVVFLRRAGHHHMNIPTLRNSPAIRRDMGHRTPPDYIITPNDLLWPGSKCRLDFGILWMLSIGRNGEMYDL